MKFKCLKSKKYWYGVYKSSVRPIIQELVESTETKLDDIALQGADQIAEYFLGED